jgi:hypothetical protein
VFVWGPFQRGFDGFRGLSYGGSNEKPPRRDKLLGTKDLKNGQPIDAIISNIDIMLKLKCAVDWGYIRNNP